MQEDGHRAGARVRERHSRHRGRRLPRWGGLVGAGGPGFPMSHGARGRCAEGPWAPRPGAWTRPVVTCVLSASPKVTNDEGMAVLPELPTQGVSSILHGPCWPAARRNMPGLPGWTFVPVTQTSASPAWSRRSLGTPSLSPRGLGGCPWARGLCVGQAGPLSPHRPPCRLPGG